MKVIHKSYKYRIYPTKEQEVLIEKHFGCCRFVFNKFLNERKEEYLSNGNSLSYYQNAKSLTEMKKELLWLKDINSQSLQSSLRNLDIAYNKFFKRTAKFPRFKKKNDNQSFHIPQFVEIKNNQLYIPKFKKGMKIKLHRDIEGKILNATLSKTTTGKFFISITCELEYQEPEKTNSFVGVDTGIKDLAILNDGTKYENIKSLKKSLKKLKYHQRQLSKKIKGSGQRNKQKIKLALIHEKVSNKRKDHLHKVSTEIIKNHDIICVEDLNVKGMIKNHKLAQALSDVGLGTFYSLLEYKASWNEKTIVKIDRFFPSSKMCSDCNWINQELTLKDRKWTCLSCGITHDRDINASKNILLQGLNILSGLGINSDIKQKQVESSSIEEAVKLETQGALTPW
jgi:putative transposase